MSRTNQHHRLGQQREPAQWIPLVLLALLALVPPETHGWPMAGEAVLVAVLAICAWRAGESTAARLLLVVAATLAIPAARFALAPGAAVWPPALALVAAGAGLSTAALRRPESFGEWVSRVLAVAGGLVSLHALYQILWGLERLAAVVASDPALPDREAMLIRLEQGRAFAAFSTPAALGGFLALAIPATLVLAVRGKGAWRVVSVAALLLQVAGLLSAASATVLAALLGALVLAVLLWRLGGRLAWAALALALVLLASVAVLRGAEVLSVSHRNSPWRLRAGNFQSAWSMARDHPWIGAGPGGFAESYPAYRKPGDNETRHVHNLPLELWAELGFPAGTAVACIFFVVFLGPLARARREADPGRRAVAVGLAAFALHNLADFTAFLPSLLWSASLLRGSLARQAEVPAPRAADASARMIAGASLTAVVAAALLSAATGVADDARSASRFAAYRGETDRARELARRAATWAPWDPDAALMFARVALLDAPPEGFGEERLDAALSRADRAVRLSPVRPAARELRATVRLRRGDYPGAYADLVAASGLYPHNEEYARARDRLEAAAVEAIERAGAQP